MPKIDALEIITFVIRMAVAIGFIFFMMVIFFSLKVEIRDDRMERFLIETADSLTSTNLADHKSVFNPNKLTETEKADLNRNIELYAKNCEYGYYLEIESLAGRTTCSNDNSCAGFCGSVCGLSSLDFGITGNCNCNVEIIGEDFCQCKKFDAWQDRYSWRYGYQAPGKTLIKKVSAEFPVGINADTVLPAKMEITAYNSFITRATCIAAKAYETKEKAEIRFDIGQVAMPGVIKRTDPLGTHICAYYLDAPYDCRYMPGLPLLESNIGPLIGKDSGVITAYPIKNAFATCNDIKADPSLITEKNDHVSAVLLCTEAAK